MAATDLIHDAVKAALVKEGWTITDDPYTISIGGVKVFADLGAERTLAAERAGRKLAVEVKSFLGASLVRDFELALGQYLLYRALLELRDPSREVYLAVSEAVHRRLSRRAAIQYVLQRYRIQILVVSVPKIEVVQWITWPDIAS